MTNKYIKLILPEYAILPAVGIIIGSLIGGNGSHNPGPLIYSFIAFALMVFGFNTLNGIFDVRIDRINKPKRPIPNGDVSEREAFIVSLVCYIVGLAISAILSIDILVMSLVFVVMTILYSVPPARLKLRFLIENITGGIIYGVIPLLVGLSVAGSAYIPLDIVIYFFLVAALVSSVKDFEDEIGDSVYHAKTIPVVFGIEKASTLVGVFLVITSILFSCYQFFAGNRAIALASAGAILLSIAFAVYLNSSSKSFKKAKENEVVFQSNISRVCVLMGLSIEVMIGLAFV